MSGLAEDQKLERRVTAGLRGASWNPALVPADMRTTVHPLSTADGSPVIGYLHARGGEKTVVFIMHPRELLVTHYLVPHLVAAGYACWVQGPRTVGNDLRLEHELAVHDVGAGMVELKALGLEKIVLLGNSGGASLFAYYNQQSRLAPADRVARTPGGRPTRLAEAELPVADAFIFVAPHPGQGKLLLNMIDPSVTEEADPFSRNPALDPFSADNGFCDGKSGGARYALEFLARYRAAQRARLERIDAAARTSITARLGEKKRIADGGPGDAYRAAFSGVFTVWRTDADPRCFDTSLDPSDRRWGSVWGADPTNSNVGSVGFARVCTPESWLSTWSGLTSLASFDRCGSAIEQPVLVIYYTGDNSVFPSDVAAIVESIASSDKQRRDVRGNHHGQSLRLDEQSGQEIAAEAVIGWMGERFPGGRAGAAPIPGVGGVIGVREPLPGIIYPPADRLKTYVEAGALPTTSLIEELITSLAQNARRPALCAPTGIISYAELDEATDRFASALIGLGLRPLDRVLFQAGNSPELVIAIIGCLKAGLIPTCTLPAHREREIGYLGRHVDARAHIVQGDDPKFDLPGFALAMQPETPTIKTIISLRGEVRDGAVRMEDMIAGEDREAARVRVAAVPRDPFQVAIFQLSGGTTGVPKVIPRMQNDYLLNATLTAETLGYRADDVMFMPMPIIHNACMICFLIPTLLTGAALVIPEDMTPAAWADAFRRTPPTVIGLIRALMPRLEAAIESAPVLEGVRFFWSADAARLLREKYRKPAFGMFGMSEGMNMYCRKGDPDEALDWTVGRPMSRFDEVKLVTPGTLDEVADEEIGELIVRGPYTLSGYYNAPERNREAFTSDGFYKPGDLLVRRLIDGEHYYAFAGRTKDVVDRGTEKINCEEVEGAVSTHAAVGGCAVVGMPDPVLGERVCAYLVLRGNHPTPSVTDLQDHLRGIGLAKFKWPERVEIIEALPLTKVGKLDKAVLRTTIAERLKHEAVGETA